MRKKTLLWGLGIAALMTVGFMVAKARGDTITLLNGYTFDGLVLDTHGMLGEPTSDKDIGAFKRQLGSTAVSPGNVRVLFTDGIGLNVIIGFMEFPAAIIKEVELNNNYVLSNDLRATLDPPALALRDFIVTVTRPGISETEGVIDGKPVTVVAATKPSIVLNTRNYARLVNFMTENGLFAQRRGKFTTTRSIDVYNFLRLAKYRDLRVQAAQFFNLSLNEGETETDVNNIPTPRRQGAGEAGIRRGNIPRGDTHSEGGTERP